MDLDNLQAFVAVAERSSFSRAAEQMFLTQPAVSRRIAALETALRAALFDRIGHRIALTEAGRALLPRARRIMAEVEDSRRAVANLSGEVAGTLHIGTSHHIGLHRLPPVLRAFIADYPDVELDIHFMDSEAACNAVAHGDLELGIVTLPPEPGETLQATVVWPDPLAIMVGTAHPLARSPSPTATELAAHSAVLPAPGTFTREVLEQAFAPLDLSLKVGLCTNYLETIKMLVSVGLGWSVLPRTMLNEELQELHLPELRMERKLGIIRHRDRTLSNAAAALMAKLTTAEAAAPGLL